MTSLTTEDFPYTLGYVMELLSVDERELMSYAQVLGLLPQKDERTSRIVFRHREIEQIKKAIGLKKHGESMDSIGRQLGNPLPPMTDTPPMPPLTPAPRTTSPAQNGASLASPPQNLSTPIQPATTNGSYSQPQASNSYLPIQESTAVSARPQPVATASMPNTHLSSANASALRSSAATRDNITTMVEAVSQVKEGILKDLGRLLDDKLSGLDEVVVELIRCKSENDSLKKKLDEAIRARENAELEVSRFKLVQFGFYRKT